MTGSADTQVLPPFAASSRPFIVVGDRAFVPHPVAGDALVEIREGIHVAWAPIDDASLMLSLFFGREADIGIAAMMSRKGFGELIADLQSIEAQL